MMDIVYCPRCIWYQMFCGVTLLQWSEISIISDSTIYSGSITGYVMNLKGCDNGWFIVGSRKMYITSETHAWPMQEPLLI